MNGVLLSNICGTCEGIDGNGYKLGGTRLDLDGLCGADNSRCKTEADGALNLNSRDVVQFDAEKVGMSLEQFLQTSQGKKLAGATGGIQGAKGILFGVPYEPGSWQDKLIEAFAGTHDYVGGTISGLYDEEGNATRGRGPAQSAIQDRWSEVAIPLTLPFAAAQALPHDVWRAISVLLRGAR